MYWEPLLATRSFVAFSPDRFPLVPQAPVCADKYSNHSSLKGSPKASESAKSKQSTEFWTRRGELRESDTLPISLSLFRPHPTVYYPVGWRRLRKSNDIWTLAKSS